MKENKAKKIILILLALICAAVLVYSLYQGLIIYIPQKQEQHRFSELQQIVEQDNKEQNTGSESVTEVENSSMTAKDDESRSNYSGISDKLYQYTFKDLTPNKRYKFQFCVNDKMIDRFAMGQNQTDYGFDYDIPVFRYPPSNDYTPPLNELNLVERTKHRSITAGRVFV